MHAFLNRPHPPSVGLRENIGFIILISMFVFLFHALFQPFGLNKTLPNTRWYLITGYSLICFFVLIANVSAAPRILKETFSEDKWTVLREIVWYCWLIVSITVCIYLYVIILYLFHYYYRIGFTHFLQYILRAFIVGLIPIVFTIVLKQNMLLKKNASAARKLIDSPSGMRNDTGRASGNTIENTVTLTADNNRDTYTFNLQDILFMAADGNYVNVVSGNAKTESTLIRNTLKSIETQVTAVPALARCHRAYIVNILKIRKISGNAQGLRLTIEGYDSHVPVSRGYSRDFNKMLETRMPM